MGLFTKTIHFAVDATLIACVLSGLKRTTGYTPNIAVINQPDVEKYAQKYLNYGDYVYEEAAGFVRDSYFFRKA